MDGSNKLQVFERKICLTLLVIAGSTLAFMLVFTVVNVVLRAFGRPIVGDVEITSFLGAVVVGFSLPYTSMRKAHVAVDFLLERLSKGSSCWLQVLTRVVSIALFAWMGWNFYIMSTDLIRSGEVTPVFRLPYYPISFGIAFCCLMQCLVLLSQIREIVGGSHE
jgi:TRAP-type C4-dicarboxylate transport system permease small subunit